MEELCKYQVSMAVVNGGGSRSSRYRESGQWSCREFAAPQSHWARPRCPSSSTGHERVPSMPARSAGVNINRSGCISTLLMNGLALTSQGSKSLTLQAMGGTSSLSDSDEGYSHFPHLHHEMYNAPVLNALGKSRSWPILSDFPGPGKLHSSWSAPMKAYGSWIHLGGRVVGSILGRMSACLAREKASEEVGTWQLQNTLDVEWGVLLPRRLTRVCARLAVMRCAACVLSAEKKRQTQVSHQPLPQAQSRLPTPRGDITKTWRHFGPPSPLLRSSLLSWASASLAEGKAGPVSEPEGPTTARRREPFNGRLCLRGARVGLGGSEVRMASVKLSVFHFCSPFSTVGITISACQTLGSTLWGIF